MSIEVLRANEHDVDAVLEIERECSSTPWNREQIEEDLYQEFSHLLVAKENGRVIAFADVHTVWEDAHINEIGTSKKERRKGAASAIMEYIDKLCTERGCTVLSLEVRESNVPAISLYEKCGFEKVGKRKRFYREPSEDAVVMIKNIEVEAKCLSLE